MIFEKGRQQVRTDYRDTAYQFLSPSTTSAPRNLGRLDIQCREIPQKKEDKKQVCISSQIERRFRHQPNADFGFSRTLISVLPER